jgi:predicted methyltransferase
LDRIIITTQSKQDLFEIDGNIYEGIADLICENVEIISDMNYKFNVYRDKYGNYILSKSELYPCFDSSDRMYENRYYRSYMICVSEDEAIKKYNYIMEHNSDCRANEETPSFLAPLVYSDDGSSSIYIMMHSKLLG